MQNWPYYDYFTPHVLENHFENKHQRTFIIMNSFQTKCQSNDWTLQFMCDSGYSKLSSNAG